MKRSEGGQICTYMHVASHPPLTNNFDYKSPRPRIFNLISPFSTSNKVLCDNFGLRSKEVSHGFMFTIVCQEATFLLGCTRLILNFLFNLSSPFKLIIQLAPKVNEMNHVSLKFVKTNNKKVTSIII